MNDAEAQARRKVELANELVTLLLNTGGTAEGRQRVIAAAGGIAREFIDERRAEELASTRNLLLAMADTAMAALTVGNAALRDTAGAILRDLDRGDLACARRTADEMLKSDRAELWQRAAVAMIQAIDEPKSR